MKTVVNFNENEFQYHTLKSFRAFEPLPLPVLVPLPLPAVGFEAPRLNPRASNVLLPSRVVATRAGAEPAGSRGRFGLRGWCALPAAQPHVHNRYNSTLTSVCPVPYTSRRSGGVGDHACATPAAGGIEWKALAVPTTHNNLKTSGQFVIVDGGHGDITIE